MTKSSRRSKRKIAAVTIEKPIREPAPISYKSSSVPPASRPVDKSSMAKIAVYDANKHIASELKYSSLVASVVIILLIVAYILFH